MKEIDRDGYLETLVDSLYEQFEMYVDEDLEFFPFGSLQREDGATRRFLTYNENADVNEALSILKKGIEEQVLMEGEYFSGGYCFAALLNKKDVICINLLSKNSDGWIKLYMPYGINNGEIEYGEYISDSK